MNERPSNSQAPNSARSMRTTYHRGRSRRNGNDPRGNNEQRPAAPPAPSSEDLARDQQFGSLRVSELVSRALQDLGYSAPTPIQEQTIPAMLQGEDLVGQAQTGTGKTAAFGIPLAETLDPEQKHVQSVVLTPTRELAVQVSAELGSLCRYRGLRVATVYGGQSINRQLDALQNGVHIVVGTPGRMLDHLGRRTLRLDRVRTAVLDEADEMLDIGFADDIGRILRFTPSSRQTALFSATMPKAIHSMVYRHLKHPTWIRIGGEAEPVEQVWQVYYEVASRDKNAGLEELLGDGHSTGLDHGGDGQTLIFRRTQRGVERLVNYLRRQGASVRGIHGRLSQGQRDAVMSAFRAGRLELLVATNLAARGLDIPAISRVINFDTPQNVEEYVHRIGRTSRMGRPGTAITFVGESEFDDFEPIQRHVGADMKRGRLALYS